MKHHQVFIRDETCFSSEMKHVFHLRSNICILMRLLLITQLMETMQYLSLTTILKYEILIIDIEP